MQLALEDMGERTTRNRRNCRIAVGMRRQFPIRILGKDMIRSARNGAQARDLGRTGFGDEGGRAVYPIGPQLQGGNDDRADQQS